MNTNGFFYIYIYPIISSIFAGFMFWIVFTALPELKRRRNIEIGVNNDLYQLNNQLFHYFDVFLKHNKHSPSFLQEKLHGCTLTEEDINISLQNKILNDSYLFDQQVANRLIIIGDELQKIHNQIDEVIKRLYSFNMFLTSDQIALLRNIIEKINRYSLDMRGDFTVAGQQFHPLIPSLSFMTKVLLELQEDFSQLRKYVFRSKRFDRTYVHEKMMMFYYRDEFTKCLSLCKKWIKIHPYDSESQISFMIRIYHASHKVKVKNKAYEFIEKLLTQNDDIISRRDLFYSLLNDPIACSIIFKKVPKDKIDYMKQTVEQEMLIQKAHIASNTELKKYYTEKKG